MHVELRRIVPRLRIQWPYTDWTKSGDRLQALLPFLVTFSTLLFNIFKAISLYVIFGVNRSPTHHRKTLLKKTHTRTLLPLWALVCKIQLVRFYKKRAHHQIQGSGTTISENKLYTHDLTSSSNIPQTASTISPKGTFKCNIQVFLNTDFYTCETS